MEGRERDEATGRRDSCPSEECQNFIHSSLANAGLDTCTGERVIHHAARQPVYTSLPLLAVISFLPHTHPTPRRGLTWLHARYSHNDCD